MKLKCTVLLFFVAIIIGTARGRFNFDYLTDISSAQVANDLNIVIGLVEDDNFIYAYSLSPISLKKINKSEVSIFANRFDASSNSFLISNSEVTNNGVYVDGYIYLLGQARIYQVPASNFSALQTLAFPVDINPVTSFYYKNAVGDNLLNFPSYGVTTPRFYQVNLDVFNNESVSSFPLPSGDFQVSAFDGNRTAYLGTFLGSFYRLDMEPLSFSFNFSVREITVTSLMIDAKHNALYFCGDYEWSRGPYLVKIDLTKVSNGATLTIPRDPNFRNRTRTNAATGVSATFVGTGADSTCKGFSLDIDRDQALAYEFDPSRSSGKIYRLNTKTMEIIDELNVNAYSSSKIVGSLLHTEEQMLYYATETEVLSVFYPANNSLVIRPPPPVPPVDPPQSELFDRLTVIASAEVNIGGLDIPNGLVEDNDHLYLYTLSPIMLAKIDKSDLAIVNNSFTASLTSLGIVGETAGTAVYFSDYIYVLGQSTIWKVFVGNLSVTERQKFSTDINPVTSFYSKGLYDGHFLNFPSYGVESNQLYQVRLEYFNTYGSTQTFALPPGDFQVSAYDGNITAYLGTYAGSFYQKNTEALPLSVKNFNVSAITVTSLRVDWKRNTLYFCGDYGAGQGSYLVKINLDIVSDGSTLTVPRDSAYTNRTQIDVATGVSATFVGTSVESTCRGFSLDTDRNLALVYEYNPPSRNGQLYRINTETMEIVEELALTTQLSRKVVAGVINTKDQLLYLLTENEVLSVFYPSTMITTPVSTPEAEPISDTPNQIPQFTIPLASAGNSILINVFAVVALVFCAL